VYVLFVNGIGGRWSNGMIRERKERRGKKGNLPDISNFSNPERDSSFNPRRSCWLWVALSPREIQKHNQVLIGSE
jgi:hypothetical protein